MLGWGISSTSTTLLQCNLPLPSLGATSGRGANVGAVRVRARSGTWEVKPGAPPPPPVVDPGIRDVLLTTFADNAVQGALWTSILLWGDGNLVLWSSGGEKLRSAACGLIAKSLLRRVLVGPTTRDFHIATTGGRRKPLSIADLHDAYFRIFATTRATQSLTTEHRVVALDNGALQERALAAAKGNVAAIADAAAACRRAAEGINDSALPETVDATAFLRAADEVHAGATPDEEPVGAVYRSVQRLT